MRSLEGRIKKLEAKGSATDARLGAILYTIVPVIGEYQQVTSTKNEDIVIRRMGGETEDQFFHRAEVEIRALTGEAVVMMVADDGEEN